MNNYVNFTPFQYLIYYFAIILGLVPFTIKKNVIRPLGILRKFYAVFIALLNAFVIFYLLNQRSSQDIDVSTVNQFVITTLHTLHAVNLCSTILTFAFKTEKLIEIWKKITAISYEVKKLRIDDNCGISWKKCCIKIIFTNGILILTILGINIAASDNWSKISWFGFIIASIHRHNAIAIFSTTIICMGKLFESLNKKLQDAVQPNFSFPSSDDRVVTNQGIANSRPRRIITEPKGVQLCVEDLQKIGKSHEEICDLIESVTDCFTVPILFNVVQNFNNLLANCYSIYSHVFMLRDIFENTDAATVSYIVSMMQWLVITLLESLLIAHACTSMSRAGNATKALLHEVWNKFYPEELRDELFMFSLQILHKPIAVSAYGFFDLGYSYIFKIFFAVVAYLIVMIQLDTSGHRNSGTSEEMRQ